MAADLWSSKRLIYRGIDKEQHEAFLAEVSLDAESFISASPIIPVPRNKKTTNGLVDWLTGDDILLSAIIYLAPSENPDGQQQGEVTASNNNNNNNKDQQQQQQVKASGLVPVGFIALTGTGPTLVQHRRCEIGITIAREYHRQGYGSEAIQWALRWGFKWANLHRIGIGAAAHNEGAVRLYERLGFVKEAVRRDFAWHNGRYHDLVELAILENEWREKYDKPS